MMMKILVIVALVLNITIAIGTPEIIQLKLHKDVTDDTCTILSENHLKKFRQFQDPTNPNELFVKIGRAQQGPADSMLDHEIIDKSLIIEIIGKNTEIIHGHVDTLCKLTRKLKPLDLTLYKETREPEIIPIIASGDKANRIDVVFMGDGYNGSQRQQFIDDINRLTTDMFEGETFRSYLPVFNIWAIFVESVDVGIGYDGPLNTPFQLYRQAGQLRGIFPGNPQYARQVCLLTGTSGCDYPSLIGNDDFYGGLGGEFVISTKSARTGTIVLRHEMGHNFVDVGEEYDGGGVYSGVNSASSVANLGWSSWLSGARREERVMYRLLAYPWHDLSTGSRSFSFTSDGTYSRWYIIVSVSAAGEANSLEFTLDGVVLPWSSFGSDDREFYDWSNHTHGFSSGSHTFTVRSLTPSTHPTIPRMIASIDIHEFGNADEFEIENDHISAYPTWDYLGRKTFRPTNAGCLMRNMTHESFCSVCKEGMWMQFLNRISLIDSVVLSELSPEGTRNATLSTLRLGKWRPIGNEMEGELLEIRWFLNSIDQVQYQDLLEIENIEEGNWRVVVQLITPDVISDPNRLLIDEQTFTVTNK